MALFPDNLRIRVIEIKNFLKDESSYEYKDECDKDLLNTFITLIKRKYKAILAEENGSIYIIINDFLKVNLVVKDNRIDVSDTVYISFTADKKDVLKYNVPGRYKITPCGFDRINVICRYNWNKLGNTYKTVNSTIPNCVVDAVKNINDKLIKKSLLGLTGQQYIDALLSDKNIKIQVLNTSITQNFIEKRCLAYTDNIEVIFKILINKNTGHIRIPNTFKIENYIFKLENDKLLWRMQ